MVMELEERVSMLEQKYERLSDDVKANNIMTADMYSVFQEMQPGFKLLSDTYSLFSRYWKILGCLLARLSKAAKIIIPLMMVSFMIYMLITKGTVPVGL
jgi:hypothetical protein